MKEQKSEPSRFGLVLGSGDPEAAALALKAGYRCVTELCREQKEPYKVRLYGYRGKNRADIEKEFLGFVESFSEKGLLLRFSSEQLLSIWKERNLKERKHILIVSRATEWIEMAVTCIKQAAAEERKKKRQGKPVGAQGVAEGATRRGYTYKTSRALIDNVIAKRDPSFFDKLPDGGEASYTDGKGKPVKLSPFQTKLVLAFAQVLDTLTDRPDVEKSIEFLTFEREEQRAAARKDGRLPVWKNEGMGKVSAFIDIPKLARLIYSVDKAGGKQINKVRDEIANLAQVRQQFRIKEGKKTLILGVPLIYTGIDLKVEEEGKGALPTRVEIAFEDIFLYELKEKYSLVPNSLFSLWKETGEKSELFGTLLLLLQQERGLKKKQADITTSAARKELKKGGATPEEIERQVASIRREALTYKETLASICERLQGGQNYYQERNGKAYLRKERIGKDLKAATAALVKMGIITEYYETKNASLEVVCNFVINDRWLIEEANKIKGLDKTEEEQTEKGG